MATMMEIEKLTKDFSDARRLLYQKVQDLKDDIAAIERKQMPLIKKASEIANAAQAKLKAAIEDAPELFVKPRTVFFHGIKIGWQKGKGELQWEDTAQVVKLIHRHFPEQADVLLKIVETPVKTALAQMSAADLKRLGITIEETGDSVLIKAQDGDIDKIVNALLKEPEEKEAA